MKLTLRARAERDLDGIFDWSVERFGADIAERYLRDLQDGMENLLQFPELGAATGLRPGLRVLAVREHRVFYRAERDAIVVARVLHRAMLASRHV